MFHTKGILFLSLVLLIFVCRINGQNRSNNKNKNKPSGSRQSFLDTSVFGKSEDVVCNNKTDQRLDTFAYQLLHHKFPTSSRELRQFCNAGLKNIGFVLGFAKHCLTDFTQKAFQVVFHPLTNEIGVICKSGRMSNKAKELIKAARCGNAARPGLKKCYDKFIEREIAIHEAKDQKRKIPMLCCEFNVLRECFKTEAEEVKICTKRTIDFVERYALEMFGEILNLMCFEYQDSSDKCTKVINEIPAKPEGVRSSKSFIPPLLQILKDIAEDF